MVFFTFFSFRLIGGDCVIRDQLHAATCVAIVVHRPKERLLD